jgi:hypothetical protein
MKDKRAVVLGPPDTEPPKKTWKRAITTNEDERSIAIVMDYLDDWFKYSQQLQMQITSLMVSLSSMQKNPKRAEPSKLQVLSDRLRPLVAMKENIDVYICQQCEVALDGMDAEWEVEEDSEEG